MPYIGNQPGTGVRSRFIYTATASQTTFTGADNNSKTLKYSDADYIDVYLNGICLVPVTDYTATSKTSVVLIQAASLNDTLEVVAYDIATISDTVSKADGGTFEASVTFADGADILTASKGTDNVRLGENAGAAIVSGGIRNVLIGKDAGTAITTGDNNTFVGAFTGDVVTTGTSNTALGFASLSSDDVGNHNTAVGHGTLNALNYSTSTDGYNTAIGSGAGETMTTAIENTLVGGKAGFALTIGEKNVAIGQGALTADTVGSRNVAVGWDALGSQVASGGSVNNYYNTCIGANSGFSLNGGYYNTFVGGLCGDDTNDGLANTAMGYLALSANCGDGNTAVGRQAGTVITGSNNACFGDGAGESITSGSDNICIGHDAGSGQVSTGNDQLYIARSNASLGTDAVFLYGGNTGALINGDNSSTFNTVSDERIKKNIVDSTKGLAEILQVKIRNFEYRTFDELDDDVKALNDGKGLNVLNKSGVKTGVIAQELEAIFPNDVTDLPDGTKNVKIENAQWALIKAVQELSAKVDALETENTAIKARLDALEAG